jgi:thiol-disulfide isomerase/thioredoxin
MNINPIADTNCSNKHHCFYDIHPVFNIPTFERVYLTSMIESKPRKILPLLFLGLGFLLIVASTFYILRENSLQTDFSTVPVQVNFSAPELTLTDSQGATHSLADYRGQVVLVNLWATWCPPCKEEMPTLQAFYNKHVNQGFVIVAINDGDPTSDVLQFLKDYQLTFPVWLDPTYIATEQAFRTANLPSSYVIDRNGTVRLMWVGGINRQMLDKYVSSIITENQ